MGYLSDYVPAANPPDKYDRAIMYLYKILDERGLPAFGKAVEKAWLNPHNQVLRGGCLFYFCNVDGKKSELPGSTTFLHRCGCLTQVRNNGAIEEFSEVGSHPRLTEAAARLKQEIIDDEAIPLDEEAIEPHHLPIFAAWQRRLDADLRIPSLKLYAKEKRATQTC